MPASEKRIVARRSTRGRKGKVLPNGRDNKELKHLRIYRYMFDSPAYRDLNATARAALHELMFRYNGGNNGYIPFSVREMAARLNVTAKTAQKALSSVVEHGFAKERAKGSFHLKNRHATEWTLTMEGYPTPADNATKDFMKWKPATILQEGSK